MKTQPIGGCQLKIGDRVWLFVSVRGRQFLRKDGGPAEEYGCLRDNAKGTISIVDTMPRDEQLACAAREVLFILGEER